jgi:hypothetical protein
MLAILIYDEKSIDFFKSQKELTEDYILTGIYNKIPVVRKVFINKLYLLQRNASDDVKLLILNVLMQNMPS